MANRYADPVGVGDLDPVGTHRAVVSNYLASHAEALDVLLQQAVGAMLSANVDEHAHWTDRLASAVGGLGDLASEMGASVEYGRQVFCSVHGIGGGTCPRCVLERATAKARGPDAGATRGELSAQLAAATEERDHLRGELVNVRRRLEAAIGRAAFAERMTEIERRAAGSAREERDAALERLRRMTDGEGVTPCR